MMLLLGKSAVLSLFLVVGSHASEVRPRGTGGGGGGNLYTPTFSPVPFPTKAPTTTLAPSPRKTESPTPELVFSSNPTPELDSSTIRPTPELVSSSNPTPQLVSSSNPTPELLTPDEVSPSPVPSSASPPTAVAECLDRARNDTDLARLDFLVTMRVPLADSVVTFLFRLREFLQTMFVADMLECGIRGVDDRSPIRDVQFDLSVNNNATFAPNSSCTNCTNIQMHVDIYYDEGWNASQIDETLFATLTSHCSRMASLAGVEEISDTCRYMSIMGPDGTIRFLDNLLNPPPEDDDLLAPDDSLSTLGVMALSFSALTIVLGILVATKRRKRQSVKNDEPMEHKDDAAYITNDSEAGSSSSESSPDLSSAVQGDSASTISDGTYSSSHLIGARLRFVAEESDSVTSSWSGVSSHQGSLAPIMESRSTRNVATCPYYPSVRACRSPDTVQL